jgi:hypothetical protein
LPLAKVERLRASLDCLLEQRLRLLQEKHDEGRRHIHKLIEMRRNSLDKKDRPSLIQTSRHRAREKRNDMRLCRLMENFGHCKPTEAEEALAMNIVPALEQVPSIPYVQTTLPRIGLGLSLLPV